MVYVGLDVSLNSVAVCVIDREGQILKEASVASEASAISQCLQPWRDRIANVGLEARPMSEWLTAGLAELGFPAISLEARQVKAALSAMPVKTDRNDARGIAQVVRAGWYKVVHVKSIGSQHARTLVAARKHLIRSIAASEQTLRGLLRPGTILAERALQVYRDRHRGSMMDRASEAFRIITRSGCSGLATRPEKDRETLIGLAGSGGSKLATDMSKGTRFQLYLALRLAGYEEFARMRQPVPFVADDIMETFDEPRSGEVLSLFGKMSEMGQVIYLTDHRHLCDLARKAVPQVVVHELPS